MLHHALSAVDYATTKPAMTLTRLLQTFFLVSGMLRASSKERLRQISRIDVHMHMLFNGSFRKLGVPYFGGLRGTLFDFWGAYYLGYYIGVFYFSEAPI